MSIVFQTVVLVSTNPPGSFKSPFLNPHLAAIFGPSVSWSSILIPTGALANNLAQLAIIHLDLFSVLFHLALVCSLAYLPLDSNVGLSSSRRWVLLLTLLVRVTSHM